MVGLYQLWNKRYRGTKREEIDNGYLQKEEGAGGKKGREKLEE